MKNTFLLLATFIILIINPFYSQVKYIDAENAQILNDGDMRDNNVLYQMKEQGDNISKPWFTNTNRKGQKAIAYQLNGTTTGERVQRSEHHIVHWKTPEDINVGDTRYTGFSVYLPNEWTNPDDWLLFHQVQQVAAPGQKGNFPFLGIYVNGSRPNLTVRSGKNGNTVRNPSPKGVKFEMFPLKKGIWYDFVVGYKFEPHQGKGWAYCWVKEASQKDWKRFGQKDMKVGYSEPDSKLLNNKIGLYRGKSKLTTRLYYDEIRYSNTFCKVNIPGSSQPADIQDNCDGNGGGSGGDGSTTDIKLPGNFQAESYVNKSGSVKTENTPGSSGKNLGFIRNNDYVEYDVDVTEGGDYIFDFMASSAGSGGTIDVLENGNKRGSISIPVNGQWHSYKKYSTTIRLSSGNKKLRLIFKGSGGYLMNLDRVVVSKKSTSGDGGNSSTQTTLTPIQDAYIQGSSRYNNTLIRIERNNRNGYLMFDLSSIKGNIKKAELSFTIASDAGNGKVDVYKGSTTNWTEQNISNSNKPSSQNLLGTINGTMNIGDRKTISLNTSAINSGKLALVMSAASGNDFAFASKEHSSVKKPQLVITYESNRANDIQDQNVIAYPNPFTNLLTIDLQNGHRYYQMDIIDVKGQRVYLRKVDENDDVLEMDLRTIPKGIYFVRLSGIDNNKNLKILKQ